MARPERAERSVYRYHSNRRGFIQVFGEGDSQEQVKGQCAELLKLKTVDDRLRFLDASPKICMNRISPNLPA